MYKEIFELNFLRLYSLFTAFEISDLDGVLGICNLLNIQIDDIKFNKLNESTGYLGNLIKKNKRSSTVCYALWRYLRNIMSRI